VRDLVRVVETEPGGYAIVAWSRLAPSRRHRATRLLLRVAIERPVECAFNVRIDLGEHREDPARRWLPLLLAAERFALAFDERPEAARGLVWVPAPTVREPVAAALSRDF